MNIDYILGFPYLKTKKMIKNSEFFSVSDIDKLQIKLLKQVLGYSIKNIPYYREKNITSENIKNMHDFSTLKKFRIIDKNIIRKNLKKLMKVNFINGMKVTTGGSTGVP